MTYGTLWYQKMSADIVWYQSITSQRCAVTAEVASSSLVVPAISFHTLENGVPLVETVLRKISQRFE